MSWYYDDESVSDYYRWYKQSKELEKLRKRKKKLQEIEKKKQAKILKKLAKEEEKIRLREERIEKRKQMLIDRKQRLKDTGWKRGYVRQDVLVRNNKAKDLNLCKEIYLKAKSGMTTRELAKEYDRPNNFILRYKYEYEAYLKALAEQGINTNTEETT